MMNEFVELVNSRVGLVMLFVGASLYVAGIACGYSLDKDPCECETCFEGEEKWVQLVDECTRCRDHEANNWRWAARDKTEELMECLDLKRIYEKQNHEWSHGEDRENQSCTCGPYSWTCQEATVRAAHAERAYNECRYDGYFPGYTILDSWLDNLLDENGGLLH